MAFGRFGLLPNHSPITSDNPEGFSENCDRWQISSVGRLIQVLTVEKFRIVSREARKSECWRGVAAAAFELGAVGKLFV